MTWGGSYFGMAQWGVTVVRLESENPPPLAEFAGAPVTLFAGQSVSFTDYSSNDPNAWEWTFEGGSPGNSEEKNPVIIYNNPGTYSVSLKVENDNGYDTKIKYAYISVAIPKIVSLKLYLEGLFNPDYGIMNQVQEQSVAIYPFPIADMINVKLAEPGFPGNIIYNSGEVPIMQDGSCIFTLPAALNGSYYIVIQHRNSIESWSACPVSFESTSITYDFTTEASQVFGSNQKQIQGNYCLYSGDINQDGIVDSGDIIQLENMVPAFVSGYLPEDLNGDGLLDSGDMLLLDNNSRLFIGRIIPE
jgi:PKD repeat protein